MLFIGMCSLVALVSELLVPCPSRRCPGIINSDGIPASPGCFSWVFEFVALGMHMAMELSYCKSKVGIHGPPCKKEEQEAICLILEVLINAVR
jgi:hypothetical protein